MTKKARRKASRIGSAVLAGTLTAWGAGNAIGVATSKGRFLVNQAPVAGQTSLIEGATIETERAPSEVRLFGGAALRLGALSRGRAHRDRFVLERGEGQLDRSSGYRLEAGTIRILPAQSARVRVTDSGMVEVAALAAPVQVTEATGALLATVSPGMALQFQAQPAGATAPYVVSGCVREADGRYWIEDPALGIRIPLEGDNLKAYVGRPVEIQGTRDASPDPSRPQPVRVLHATPGSGTCPASSSGSAGSTPSAKTGSSGAKKAILAGILVAGAAAGAAVALEEPEQQPTTISP
jgi:hypothetical protein